MLAATYNSTTGGGKMRSSFPLLATPKIDGIRALIVGGKLVSRSFKKIPNVHVRAILEGSLPEGADGEIQCGTFRETTSIVMSQEPMPDNFAFFWFDWAYDVNAPYEQRIKMVYQYYAMSIRHIMKRNFRIVPLLPKAIYDMHQLKQYEKYILDKNYEGLVVRSPKGIYKSGRSKLSEGFMIKIKAYEDYEAVAIGTEELMHNTNDVFLDNFGNSKRSSRKDGKVPGDTLGAIIVKTSDNVMFKIGTGFTAEERKAIWSHRDELIGRYIKYKCVATDKHDVPQSSWAYAAWMTCSLVRVTSYCLPWPCRAYDWEHRLGKTPYLQPSILIKKCALGFVSSYG